MIDNIESLGKTVISYAPLLGSVLLGPSGNAIGQLIAAKFGNPPDLVSTINADPNAAEKLLEIQSNNEVQLQQIALQNVSSARQREVDLARSGHPDTTTRNLAYMITFGFFACIVSLFIFTPEDSTKEILLVLLGSLATNFANVNGYYFGSSDGSKKKDKTIADIASQ